MRILLATEGDSDEAVAEGILRSLRPDANIDPKRFPARGLSVVLRLLPDTVRAAHFGFYDLLIVHADLDDTLPAGASTVQESPRWRELESLLTATLVSLPNCNRPKPLLWTLMTPDQSTDAWLCWGCEGGNGREWERKSRHDLKARLYGTPAIGMVQQARGFTQSLLAQLAGNPHRPLSLGEFIADLAVVFSS